MYQPAPGHPYLEPCITAMGQRLPVADNFTYLCSTLSRSVVIDTEINNRIAKASAAFDRLRKNVWDRRGLSYATKIKVYRAVVLTVLQYASESWTVYSRHAQQLNHFHLSCLRKILWIRWQDKIPDTEVLKQAQVTGIHTLLLKIQVGLDTLSECPNIGYLSSCFMVNSARESALLADRRNASRTVSNSLWKPWISTSTTGKPPLWVVRPGDIDSPSELLQQRPVVLSQSRESALIARLEPHLHRLPHLQTSAPHVVANSELVSVSPVTCGPTNNSRISWSRGHLRFRRTNNICVWFIHHVAEITLPAFE